MFLFLFFCWCPKAENGTAPNKVKKRKKTQNADIVKGNGKIISIATSLVVKLVSFSFFLFFDAFFFCLVRQSKWGVSSLRSMTKKNRHPNNQSEWSNHTEAAPPIRHGVFSFLSCCCCCCCCCCGRPRWRSKMAATDGRSNRTKGSTFDLDTRSRLQSNRKRRRGVHWNSTWKMEAKKNTRTQKKTFSGVVTPPQTASRTRSIEPLGVIDPQIGTRIPLSSVLFRCNWQAFDGSLLLQIFYWVNLPTKGVIDPQMGKHWCRRWFHC